MKQKHMMYLVTVLLICFVSLWGCPKKAEVTTSEGQKEMSASSEAQKATGSQNELTASTKEVKPQERAAMSAEGIKAIYFDFDKSFVRKDAEPVLQANAEWLKANPTVRIRIEGNCDERGTIEYNQALGQRRASSAKKYLTDMGISASRISVVSYGKEKPSCTESNEVCWQKNRRDDFVVIK